MSSNLQNSIWPNADGTLGQIKVQIPDGVTTPWPKGDALVGNFVFNKGKLVGLVDTKALIANDSKTTTFPYEYVNIQLDKSLEGVMTFNGCAKPEYLIITYVGSANGNDSFDFVIVDFNTTDDQETINTIRTAKRVVDNKLYDTDDNLIGTWDGSKIEVGGIFDEGAMKADGLFCNMDVMAMGMRGLSLSEFNSDMSSLRDGSLMFTHCINLTSFNADLSSLSNGFNMFYYCIQLKSFSSNLSSLTNGNSMFAECYSLTSFSSDLSSLEDGEYMFEGCKLDTVSVQHIADTINTVTNTPKISISIGNSQPNEQETAAFNTMVSKGWRVYVDVGGGSSLPWSPTSLTPIDGEEQQTPIPYWAKPVPSDKKHAHYVDSEGNYYNILGGNYIYGDSLETYGMFTSLVDAAANMRLTKIEK